MHTLAVHWNIRMCCVHEHFLPVQRKIKVHWLFLLMTRVASRFQTSSQWNKHGLVALHLRIKLWAFFNYTDDEKPLKTQGCMHDALVRTIVFYEIYNNPKIRFTQRSFMESWRVRQNNISMAVGQTNKTWHLRTYQSEQRKKVNLKRKLKCEHTCCFLSLAASFSSRWYFDCRSVTSPKREFLKKLIIREDQLHCTPCLSRWSSQTPLPSTSKRGRGSEILDVGQVKDRWSQPQEKVGTNGNVLNSFRSTTWESLLEYLHKVRDD